MGKIYDATFGWGFSALWDRAMSRAEKAGLREIRRQVLSDARGRTLDIGAGTGANIGLFPEAVTELFFVEPDPHMAHRMRPKVKAAGSSGEVVMAGAEDLPFEDASIDTAVFALSLCTIPNPWAALSEVARVLRPGGQLLFLEHVRADSPRLSHWQDRLEKPWHFLADGCYCNRDTLGTIEASAHFKVENSDKGEMRRAATLTKPLVFGRAALVAG